MEDVNKIGARIKKDVLSECKKITERTKSLSIFKHDLDQFLSLDEKDRNEQIKELNEIVIQKLFKINGIGLSTATKILHTLYPKIIPMIDKALQKKYSQVINDVWTENRSDEIFIDFYKNLQIEYNWKNLNHIFKEISKNNLKNLTRIRIFDILWWSFLKVEKLKKRDKLVYDKIY